MADHPDIVKFFAGEPVLMQQAASPAPPRAGLWDYVCVPGHDEKDGQSTDFDETTMRQMVGNFERRSDPIPLDHNHQSNYARLNGQPAPALAFYGALALVWGGRVAALAVARDTPPLPGSVFVSPAEARSLAGLDLSRDGLHAFRSEVTKLGLDLLPNFKLLSPTFTPQGTLRDGTAVGYVLAAVAATNTPWQGRTEISFELAEFEKKPGDIVKCDRCRGTGSLVIVRGTAPETCFRCGGSGKLRIGEDGKPQRFDVGSESYAGPADGSGGRIVPVVSAASAASRGEVTHMPNKLGKLAKFAGVKDGADDEAVKAGLSKKMADEASAAMGDEKFPFAQHAEALEGAAKQYEDANPEADDGEPAHVKMRRMASQFRRLAKLGDAPAEGAPAMAADGEAKAEDAKKEMARAFAGRLGVKLGDGLTSVQMFDVLKAQAVGASQLPNLISEAVGKQLAERDAVAAQREHLGRAKQLVFDALAGGYPADLEQDLLRAASDPATFEAIRASVAPYVAQVAARDQTLFAQTVHGGAPAGSAAGRTPGNAMRMDRVVVENELATFIEDGGNFSRMAIEMAESTDGKTRAKLDALLSDNERAHAGMRLIAANRVLKQERPDLWAAAEKPYNFGLLG